MASASIAKIKHISSQPWFASSLVVGLVLLPFIAAAILVKQYAVDLPFNDDWTFLEDWMKWKEGTLALGDLFTAHMEHRVTVPRVIALALHAVGGADLRWQNAFTLLLLLGTGWNVLALLRKTSRQTLPELWLPLLLMSGALFCSIQWQGLLWPILFEAYIPVFCLTISVRLWYSATRPWIAFAISALATLAGMWSFGNGLLSWVLVPFLFWTSRDELSRRQRWQLSAAWFVCTTIAAVLYSLNFGNAVPAQFAYGQGTEVTAGHSIQEFVKHLSGAPRFISALLGSHLSRGLHLDNLLLAEVMGYASLIIYALALLELWRGRRDVAFVRQLMPWLLIGLFSIGTASLIALGRLWLSKSGTLAITVRYVSHAIPLTVSLVALVYLLGRHWTRRHPQVGSVLVGLAGAMMVLLATQWIYGARYMYLWEQTRLQCRALLLFAKVLPNGNALGAVGADGGYVQPLALKMERLGLMHPKLLQNLRLDQFSIDERELPTTRARFDSLELRPDGSLYASGYAELPSQRPADLVLFTTPNASGEKMIFAFGALESVPRYLYDSTKRDREFLAIPNYSAEWTARWAGPLTVFSKPALGDEITAWALDAKRLRIQRIADGRRQPGQSFLPHPLPAK